MEGEGCYVRGVPTVIDYGRAHARARFVNPTRVKCFFYNCSKAHAVTVRL